MIYLQLCPVRGDEEKYDFAKQVADCDGYQFAEVVTETLDIETSVVRSSIEYAAQSNVRKRETQTPSRDLMEYVWQMCLTGVSEIDRAMNKTATWRVRASRFGIWLDVCTWTRFSRPWLKLQSDGTSIPGLRSGSYPSSSLRSRLCWGSGRLHVGTCPKPFLFSVALLSVHVSHDKFLHFGAQCARHDLGFALPSTC